MSGDGLWGLILGAFAPSMMVCWAAAYGVRRLAAGWGLVDAPGGRKSHAAATPLGGGLAIWLGVVAPLAAGRIVLGIVAAGRGESPAWPWAANIPLPRFVEPHVAGLVEQSDKLWLLLGAATVLLLLGLIDDVRSVDWRWRVLVQTGVAALVVWQGWRLSLFIDLPWFTALVSVCWIVGLVNSFNMLDNMDGLSAGVAAISAGMLAAVMLLAPDPETNQPQLFVGGLLVVLVGALTGFLWHNRPPARLFMGDAGSYFIGFLLATSTIMATFAQRDRPHAILAPLCVLAVPLYDTATVVWIRLREGRSPFEGDARHFSHRLVELGMTRPQAVLTIYLLSAACGLGAFLLHQVDGLGAIIILLLVTCVLALVGILETVGCRNLRK